jgi:glucose-6-phosphate 1-epimerase
MTDQIEALNARFALADHVVFQVGENGLPKASIHNALATAEVYLQGAQVTAFRPQGPVANPHDVLWLSPLAQFETGKAIRGGVPIIWPWFGPLASDSNKPQHGFARTAEWQVTATEALADGTTRLQLQLTDNAATRALWPHVFALCMTIDVGTELRIDLTCRNTGDESFVAGGALHSYFALGDVANMRIEGLAGREYIDQLDGHRIKPQSGAVRITQAVDRIYLDTEDVCVIHDDTWSRQVRISKQGSRSTVVWNPWVEKGKAMSDFSDQGYRNMVCIEAANAADDVYRLAPGEEHTLSQIIRLSAGA